MIELYGGGTPNVYKVLLMLAETGLPYEVRPVNVAAEEQFRPDFVALNPNSKIPVIVDRDGPGGKPHTVIESGAILIYLADKTGRFLPKDPAARSTALQWLMWQMASVGPMFGQALHFSYVAPPDMTYARNRFVTEANRLYDVANTRLGQAAYLGGDDYSIADMAAWPWLSKYHKSLKLDLGARPHVARWVTEIENRPAQLAVQDEAKTLFKRDRVNQETAKAESLDRFFGRGKWVRA